MNEDLKLFLASHPLASDFICSTEVKQISDIKQYIADFYAFCKEKKIDDFDNELWFKILQEKVGQRISTVGGRKCQEYSVASLNIKNLMSPTPRN